MKIVAVVVTYNRFLLLQRVIASLTGIEEVSQIVVVDNGSTDGTAEWLDQQDGLTVIHQVNVGGSGGFYTGINKAYESGADWIWCMDDDVAPQPDCLRNLLKEATHPQIGILCPKRMTDDKTFVNECGKINVTSLFSSMHQEKLSEDITVPTKIEGMVFEGPLIRREVVESIGLPNKDLFIFYDDTDYSYRATLAGFKVVYIPSAIMRKEVFFQQHSWADKLEKKRWKHFYQLRNAAYFNHHYGKNNSVRYGRALFTLTGYIAGELLYMIKKRKNSWPEIVRLWQAYQDGINERLSHHASS